MHTPVTKAHAGMLRPYQCDSPSTLGSDDRDGGSSQSFYHVTDTDGDRLSTGGRVASTVVSHDDFGSGSIPISAEEAEGPSGSRSDGCDSPAHSQGQDVCKGTASNASNSGHSDPADNLPPSATLTTAKTQKAVTVALPPRPIDFPTMDEPQHHASTRRDNQSTSFAPAAPHYHQDACQGRSEWLMRTPPLTHHYPSGGGTTGISRPWSFSSQSTPTTLDANGFPATQSPTAWRTEPESNAASSSIHPYDTNSTHTPNTPHTMATSSYYNGFASSPTASGGHACYSPVSTPSRQMAMYEGDRYADGFLLDGSQGVMSGAPSGLPLGGHWGYYDCAGGDSGSGRRAVTQLSAYTNNAFSPQSGHDEPQFSESAYWGSECGVAGYSAGASARGRHGGYYGSPIGVSHANGASGAGGSAQPQYWAPGRARNGTHPPSPHAASSLTSLASSSPGADFTAVPERTKIIARFDFLSNVCQRILRDAAAASSSEKEEDWWHLTIALDLEGRDLGRHGSVCIITMATIHCVYLVDMVELGAAALAPGSPLRCVLESPLITKLMYDCRADCDALFFLYNVRLTAVCDLQPSACLGLFPNCSHLPGMKDAFQRLGLLHEAEKDIKEAGKTLFDPKSGGSFEHWEVRPLVPLLAKYCAVDVKYFFMACSLLWPYVSAGYDVGHARITQVCGGRFEGCCKGNALRDFA